jgi:hypothetical protein
VLQANGVLVVLDEFPFERFDRLLNGLPLAVIDRAERALDISWDRDVAERAVALYAGGWATQARVDDEAARGQARRDTYLRMAADMERQLAQRGTYVPFGPVRMVVAEGMVQFHREGEVAIGHDHSADAGVAGFSGRHHHPGCLAA